jgi:hypothetical protein
VILRKMSPPIATWIMAFKTSMCFSQFRARRRQRVIQPKVRSTTHRRGRTLKPGSASILRTISDDEILERRLVHEFSAVICAVGEEMIELLPVSWTLS